MQKQAIFLCFSLLAVMPAFGQVSFEQVLEPDSEPGNWLSYSRTLDNQRHSLLDEVNTETVKKLELQ